MKSFLTEMTNNSLDIVHMDAGTREEMLELVRNDYEYISKLASLNSFVKFGEFEKAAQYLKDFRADGIYPKYNASRRWFTF